MRNKENVGHEQRVETSAMRSYRRFCGMLNSGKLDSCLMEPFGALCRKLDVDPAEVESMLVKELGMTGEETLDLALRRAAVRHKVRVFFTGRICPWGYHAKYHLKRF